MCAWIADAPGVNVTMIMKGVVTMIKLFFVVVGIVVIPALFVWAVLTIGGRDG